MDQVLEYRRRWALSQLGAAPGMHSVNTATTAISNEHKNR
ncbi:hypothetical protein SAMN06265218_11171 [Fodinibius sediminis]|uniref:Uncharacterized protein n=1 Tax=Fodinibius sediminis TaxID=1214077 RepID=A0A521DNU0_9BACT|nr:hypothetical protein SAMN06265218_11171 [Fodinibius sediminis]